MKLYRVRVRRGQDTRVALFTDAKDAIAYFFAQKTDTDSSASIDVVTR